MEICRERDLKPGFIGVMDSGLGGISVLAHMVCRLPSESFLYFGDSANAPYGNKPAEEVLELSRGIVSRFVGLGAKAVVIACNTATSVAATPLRQAYPDLAILGVEPAVKPAIADPHRGRVLVMATEMTIARDKFSELVEHCGGASEVVAVACPGLAESIEKGDLGSPELLEAVRALVGDYAGEVDSVVLGCTHYPFVKRQISEVMGEVAFYDGGEGTARHLERVLGERGLLAGPGESGGVRFESSVEGGREIELYGRFLDMAVKELTR